MTPREFCYWLQGFFEIKGQLKGDIKEPLTSEQVTMIRDHLQYVFTHIGEEKAAKQMADLQKLLQPLPGAVTLPSPLPGTTPYTPLIWDNPVVIC